MKFNTDRNNACAPLIVDDSNYDGNQMYYLFASFQETMKLLIYYNLLKITLIATLIICNVSQSIFEIIWYVLKYEYLILHPPQGIVDKLIIDAT